MRVELGAPQDEEELGIGVVVDALEDDPAPVCGVVSGILREGSALDVWVVVGVLDALRDPSALAVLLPLVVQSPQPPLYGSVWVANGTGTVIFVVTVVVKSTTDGPLEQLPWNTQGTGVGLLVTWPCSALIV